MLALTLPPESAKVELEAERRTNEERDVLIQIVRQAQGGDRAAFEELVSRTEKMARKIAFSTVGPEQVDDAFQESYLLVLRKIGQLKTPEAFISWFSRIVLHVCFDLRKTKHQEVDWSEHRSSPDHANRVSDNVSVHRALGQPQRQDRELLVLRELLELSYEEIAGALRLPLGTVKSRLNKARQRLADRLGNP